MRKLPLTRKDAQNNFRPEPDFKPLKHIRKGGRGTDLIPKTPYLALVV